MPDARSRRLWESQGLPAMFARAALLPASWAYAAAVAARNAAYDRGWLAAEPLALPAVSVGNLTVGGTGKTPVAAFVAAELKALGRTPAVLMRGYGGDERLVHERLNTGVPVVVGADRVRGALEARALGCDVAVLDDAFQHRRAKRDLDLVLVSADLAGPVHQLPAGPWREPHASLARASMVIVTRKAAGPERAHELAEQLTESRAQDLATHTSGLAPVAIPAIVHLAADRLVRWDSGEQVSTDVVRNQSIIAIAAIGDPHAFAAQLRLLGARPELVAAPDHHPWTAAEAAVLARRSAVAGMAVCTLKDAVKLGPVWPREAPPLWYLSQRVVVETGAAELHRLLASLASLASLAVPAPAVHVH